MPALMCTTVPPAKSSAPICQSQPALRVHRVDDVGSGVRVRARPEPDHVRDRQVGEREPQHHEQQHRRELHALGERAEDQAAGDGGERRLERDVDELGDRRRPC